METSIDAGATALRQRVQAAYEVVARSYAEWIPDVRFEAPLDLAMVDRFVAEVGNGAARVLDAGCGTGRMTTYLRQRDPELEVVGVDLSPAMAEVAREANPDVAVEVADLGRLPFADASFDGVLAWYSIIHLPPSAIPDVLVELHRVLRPGGAVLLGFQAGRGERPITRPYGHDVELPAFLHERRDVEGAATALGFEVVAGIDRPPREPEWERHPQGFVLLERVG